MLDIMYAHNTGHLHFMDAVSERLIQALKDATQESLQRIRAKVIGNGGNSASVPFEKHLFFTRLQRTQDLWEMWRNGDARQACWEDDPIFSEQVIVFPDTRMTDNFFSDLIMPAIKRHRPRTVFLDILINMLTDSGKRHFEEFLCMYEALDFHVNIHSSFGKDESFAFIFNF